uniref:Uncharacterized protein n=1 Tax=Branchiostoma floridae TaxID=7739 RepID=C3ZYN8_BRAFL|eukprot:XP_002586329.1 hypothetical protein BRAFLDRAFT_108984 [Branchiostoma floridae]
MKKRSTDISSGKYEIDNRYKDYRWITPGEEQCSDEEEQSQGYDKSLPGEAVYPEVRVMSHQFEYRPFIINWCLTLQILDGQPISRTESLKAEWLYSQGRGRHFQPGQQAELAEYLSTVCPPNAQSQFLYDDSKLQKVLSKQQLHQHQLQHPQLRPQSQPARPANQSSPRGQRAQPANQSPPRGQGRPRTSPQSPGLFLFCHT